MKKNSFIEQMEALEDIELLKVIKLKDEYQKEAAGAAIVVALKRNLIDENCNVIASNYIENAELEEADSTSEKIKQDEIKNKIGRKKRPIRILIFIATVLFLTLPFHYVPSAMKIFPKDNLTFSHTIITQDDVDKLLKRYNDCETIFQQQSIRNEPLFRKLSEKGIIYDKKKTQKI